MNAILALLLLASPPLPVAPAMSKIQFTAAGAVCTVAAASCKVLNEAVANGLAATRTFVLPVAGFSKVSIQVDLTRVAATDVQLTCTASLDGGGHYASITATKITGGTGTVTAYHDSYATTSTGNVLFEYDTRTYGSMQCVVGSTAGTTDTYTVFAVAAVGQ
jgi:hypothetical protein